MNEAGSSGASKINVTQRDGHDSNGNLSRNIVPENGTHVKAQRSSSVDSGLDVGTESDVIFWSRTKRRDISKTFGDELLRRNNCSNVEQNFQSQSITCLPSESTSDCGYNLQTLSDGVRTQLSRNLQETSRNSFANQIGQISRTYSADSTTDQWGTEISQPLSALYAILIVIISACLAFSSQLTNNVDSMYSRYFDSSLLALGVVFLASSFAYLYRKQTSASRAGFFQVASGAGSLVGLYRTSSSDATLSLTPSGNYWPSEFTQSIKISETKIKRVRVIHAQMDSASFYLKMGTLSFAIGSMIYACLELGVFAENTSCFNAVMCLNPILFILFVILQLYFVFLNSRLTLNKYRSIGRFGLMHLVATNLCIWIRTLIDETLHAFGKIHDEQSERNLQLLKNKSRRENDMMLLSEEIPNGNGGYNPLCVDDESVMKKMMEEASAFLYPCIIEYSLISAGILYIMWTFVGCESENTSESTSSTTHREKKAYAVDCDQSAKGLFLGILVVVLTIVSLILYYLYLEKPGYTETAVLQAQITEIILYTIGLVSVTYSFAKLTHNLERISRCTTSHKLDETLLQISMIGVYTYSVMSILGGYAEDRTNGLLSVASSTLCLVQSTAQTIFIFDASQRSMGNAMQTTRSGLPTNKPARETITLLLIVNFAIWATNVFCTLRYESSPSQTEFYGMHEWTAMLHVTVPLVIFYRFHSTACLFEIWKRAYKEKRISANSYGTLSEKEFMTNV